MRLLVIAMTLLLFIAILTFTMTNLDTRVDIVLMEAVYPEVRLIAIVFLAILTGIVYASVIGVAEGVSLRLANRRLQREIRRLEAELSFLRTERESGRPEPDLPVEPGTGLGVPEPQAPAAVRPQPAVASAPVYGEDEEGPDGDPGEDAYSGRRAV
jgi:uncharacterized integral membrane protein